MSACTPADFTLRYKEIVSEKMRKNGEKVF